MITRAKRSILYIINVPCPVASTGVLNGLLSSKADAHYVNERMDILRKHFSSLVNLHTMKAPTILFLLLLWGGLSLHAQTGVLNEVPGQAKDFLKMKFPEATDAAWTRLDDDQFRARFRKAPYELDQHAAIFSSDGTWVETLTPIPLSQLPESIIPSATDAKRGYDVARAYLVDKGDPDHLFELKMRKKGHEDITVRYNANGYMVTQVPVKR